MSLVEVQLDKIMAFTELPNPNVPLKERDFNPYWVLYEKQFENKLNKMRLAACIADQRVDFLTVT